MAYGRRMARRARSRRIPTGRTSLATLAVAAAVVLVAAACTDDAVWTDAAGDAGQPTAAEASRETCRAPQIARPVEARPAGADGRDLDLLSFDDTPIRLHWFPRPGAGADDPAPIVLMGPGWSLPGQTDPDGPALFGSLSISGLHDAGYNVLTWDPRGFGASGGTAQVNDPGVEGRDMQQLLEWAAEQPEVLLDGERDPRVGMVGGSYGGGIQLVTAAIDCRVDAIVPTLAWHSLGTSLYPNETVKLGWAGVLADAGAGNAVDPVVTRSYEVAAMSGRLSDEDREWYLARGPAELVERVTAPTLLVQGTVDTLFTLSEAVTNFELLESNGVPVSMIWFCGGHGLCLTDADDDQFVAEATLAWLDRWVAGDTSVDTGAPIVVQDDDGELHRFDSLPQASSTVAASGSGALELSTDSVAGPLDPADAPGDLLTGIAASITPTAASDAVEARVMVDEPTLVLGTPLLELTYRLEGVEPGDRPVRVFAQLVDDATGTVVGNQSTPVPLRDVAGEHRIELPLEQVVVSLEPGEALTLQIVATSVAFGEPRLGGTARFSEIDLELPVVEAP